MSVKAGLPAEIAEALCNSCPRLKVNSHLGEHSASYHCYDCGVAICQNVFEAHKLVLTASTHNVVLLEEEVSAEKKAKDEPASSPHRRIHSYFNSLVASLRNRQQQLLDELQSFNQEFEQKQRALEEKKKALLSKLTTDPEPQDSMALAQVLTDLKQSAPAVKFTGDDRFVVSIASLGRIDNDTKESPVLKQPLSPPSSLKPPPPPMSLRPPLPLLPKFQAKFLSSFGKQGLGRGEYYFPIGLAMWHLNKKEGKEFIVVADNGNSRVVICDKKGTFVRIIGEGKGDKVGLFNNPCFVIVENHEIFISDRDNHRIQVYNPYDGKFIKTIGRGKGKGKGELTYPKGLAIVGNRLFISEGIDWNTGVGNNRISIFNHETGEYITSFGSKGAGPSQFNNPIGITSDNNGKLYIVDSWNHRIQVHNEEGVYLSQIGGKMGSGAGELKCPVSIIIRDSELFISELNNHRISIWDKHTGNYVRCFGTEGSGPGQFSNPNGMILTSQNELVVCDCYNHRLQIFE